MKQPRAARWLERLWEEQAGRTIVQVLNEYYTTLTRKIRPALPSADAWDDVKSLIAWNPQATDLELLHRGREIEERYRLSWWDSLIVSEDLTSYSMERVQVHAHPRRGRPRRAKPAA
jgi:predicted nucleic acid-binding protein